jgi:Uma2 family endonuclease
MSTVNPTRATIDDLYQVEGKAELIGGRIVELMGTGHLPNRVAAKIFRSLDDYAESTGHGVAYTDNVVLAVPELSSGRESFSPDAYYYDGLLPTNPLKFINGPPTFAVEVRSEGDYGPTAEREMAAKRADYFEAGTKIVWDVDPIERVIRAYRSDQPETATTYACGEIAAADPTVPGWHPRVDSLFPAR